jgi:hypothetical protein
VVAWAGKKRIYHPMCAAIRIDDWDKFQQMKLIWQGQREISFTSFVDWTRSEKWHLRFFDCDWARDPELALRVWFHVSLRWCGSRVFSMIVQRLLESLRTNYGWDGLTQYIGVHSMLQMQKNGIGDVWSEYTLILIRQRTLASFSNTSADDIRRAYSDEIIREKQRGIDEFVYPYLSLLDTVPLVMISSLHRGVRSICADHAEVERRLFPDVK